MRGTLTTVDGSHVTATADAVRTLIDEGTFFWLNLDTVDAEAADLLLHSLNFHPLAIEDAQEFHQRPKIDEYEGFTYFVVHGAEDVTSAATVEVHFFYTPKHVVTVHRGCEPVFDEVRERIAHHPRATLAPPAVAILYLVVDTLVDSFFPVLAALDDRIDELEDSILASPTEQQLGELFAMKRQLVSFRKVISPQRDMFAAIPSGVDTLPELTEEDGRYFRDLYDHLIRISDLVDSYRDLVSGAVDTHLSTVSNRLNVVMKQLTIIATVFLPLSFLTGFFGQNFAFLLKHISAGWQFWVFGIGLELAAVGGLFALFVRRGWMGGPSA
jgi:magnesium transporter